MLSAAFLALTTESFTFLRSAEDEVRAAGLTAAFPLFGASFCAVTFFEVEIFLTTVTFSVLVGCTLVFLTGAAFFAAGRGAVGFLAFYLSCLGCF